jgi:hypothetical protein
MAARGAIAVAMLALAGAVTASPAAAAPLSRAEMAARLQAQCNLNAYHLSYNPRNHKVTARAELACQQRVARIDMALSLMVSTPGQPEVSWAQTGGSSSNATRKVQTVNDDGCWGFPVTHRGQAAATVYVNSYPEAFPLFFNASSPTIQVDC